MKMMNFYFAGSIRGGRDRACDYQQIVAFLKTFGNVLTEHICNRDLTANGEPYSDQEIYERDIGLIRQADILVSEVTQPSLGVGYEIGFAEALRIPVIALYKQSAGRLSAMIRGNPYVAVLRYSDVEELKIILKRKIETCLKESGKND